jgi:hypothetical protein
MMGMPSPKEGILGEGVNGGGAVDSVEGVFLEAGEKREVDGDEKSGDMVVGLMREAELIWGSVGGSASSVDDSASSIGASFSSDGSSAEGALGRFVTPDQE